MNSSPNQSLGKWLELRLRPSGSEQARHLLRSARKLGAAHVLNHGGELKAIWPEDQAGLAAAEQWLGLAQGAQISRRSFRAHDPLEAWSKPSVEVIAPNLRLGTLSGGAVAGRDTIVIDPLTSFGAGDHPSTRLNLALLAGILADPLPGPEGAWLADLGTGSGILALAMALLSSRPVVAIDPESASRRAVGRNRALNPLAGHLVHFAQTTHLALSGSYPLVAANLPPGILQSAAQVAAGVLSPGGRLVLSGFRTEDAGEVAEAFGEHGLEVVQRAEQSGWTGLVMGNQ